MPTALKQGSHMSTTTGSVIIPPPRDEVKEREQHPAERAERAVLREGLQHRKVGAPRERALH